MDLNIEIIQIKECLFELSMIRPHTIEVGDQINRCVNMLYFLSSIEREGITQKVTDNIYGLILASKNLITMYTAS